jgi:hypothetical protein
MIKTSMRLWEEKDKDFEGVSEMESTSFAATLDIFR